MANDKQYPTDTKPWSPPGGTPGSTPTLSQSGSGNARDPGTVAGTNGNTSPIVKPGRQNEQPIRAYTDTGTGNARAGVAETTGAPRNYVMDPALDPNAAGNTPAQPTTEKQTTGKNPLLDAVLKVAQDKANEYRNPAGGNTTGAGTGTTGGTPTAAAVDATAQMQDIYGQTIDKYRDNAQALIDSLSSVTQQQLADYAAQSGQTIDQAKQQINDALAELQRGSQPASLGRLGNVNTDEQRQLLDELVRAQQEQATGRIDYAVQQGVDQLSRAQEDAKSQYQTMRNQVAANEATALDNQALYSEARGDRGGIGQAQYASIQNNAATNQLTVNREQTKLATDTARQIADLRAQGEFQKADQLLSISQDYLSRLMQLKQWADETNLSIDEFNLGVDQWEQEYNAKIQQALSDAKIGAAQYAAGLDLDRQTNLLNQALGAAQREATLGLDLESSLASMGMTAAADTASRAASAAQQLIAAGVTPTDQQLAGLGWNRDQYNSYKALVDAAKSSSGSSGGGGTNFVQKIRDAIENNVVATAIQDSINNAKASGNYSADIIQQAQSALNTATGTYKYVGKYDGST